MKKNLIISSLVLAGTAMATSVALAAPTQADVAAVMSATPGAQLQRAQEYMERERVARQIEEDKLKNREALIKKQDIKGEQQGEGPIDLKELQVDSSKVLSAEEINSITAPYVGHRIDLKDLYAVANKINELYGQKGYITCRAYLPAQRVKNGVVRIKLLEGVTGKVAVVGNESTKEKYITNRIALHKDAIMNINDLNKDLLRFNGTNDMQLRIAMQAGEEAGTTDYIIQAYEPKKQNWTIYSDNQGSETSGQWRQGLFYNIRSLSGERDSLNISYVHSQGTNSIATGYSRQLGHSGTKLNVGLSGNRVKIVSGPMEPMGVKGHAYAMNVGVSQPLIVTSKTRAMVGLDLGHQNSNTKFAGIPWVDDTLDDISLNYTLTNYGKSHIFYQKHSYSYGLADSIKTVDPVTHKVSAMDNNRGISRYIFDGLYQKGYNNGSLLNARLGFQWSPDDYLPSARQFYIGGMNSVRGYKESMLSGDGGVNYSIEFSMPVINKVTSAYVFTDGGYCFGDSAFDDSALYSIGAGIRTTYKDKVFANLCVGVPMLREINGKHCDTVRVHFVVNAVF